MQPTAVQELMSQKCPIAVRRKTDVRGPIRVGEARGNNAEKIKELVDPMRKHQLKEKHQRINKNQRAGHDRH